MNELRFEWGDGKAESNRRKHGVTFEEAETVFDDPTSVEAKDEKHSRDEDRWVLIGLSIRLRLLTVIYTERNEKVRIISARRSNRTETGRYSSQAFGA